MKAAAFPDGELDAAFELGAVDDRSVRVWLRAPGSASVTAQLMVAGQPAAHAEIELSAETDWTGAIRLTLDQPAPRREFTVRVQGRQLQGRLAPAPGAATGFTFGFGSCHRPFVVQPDGSVRTGANAGFYPALTSRLKEAGAELLFLVGDQVYADELPGISVRDQSNDEQHPPSLQAAIAAYRRTYRGYFGQQGFRQLRESVPTLCMWDDHEIFNDWGSLLEQTPLDSRFFEAASRTYCEYQHQRNPGGALKPPPYQFAFSHGDVGFLALDLRGARDYPCGHLMGAAQTAWVRDYLAGEEAARLGTLFVVSSVPVAHVSRWLVALLQHLPGDQASPVRDRWCSSHFVDARDRLLGELFDWQRHAAHRQVVLLSGDVHAAGAFTIEERGGSGVIQQFTSSALTTHTGWREQLVTAIGTRAPNLLEPRWRFRRRLTCYANNAGLVRLTPLKGGGHRIEFQVHAWLASQQRIYDAGRIVAAPQASARTRP